MPHPLQHPSQFPAIALLRETPPLSDPDQGARCLHRPPDAARGRPYHTTITDASRRLFSRCRLPTRFAPIDTISQSGKLADESHCESLLTIEVRWSNSLSPFSLPSLWSLLSLAYLCSWNDAGVVALRCFCEPRSCCTDARSSSLSSSCELITFSCCHMVFSLLCSTGNQFKERKFLCSIYGENL
jgi:hypothetical protein